MVAVKLFVSIPISAKNKKKVASFTACLYLLDALNQLPKNI
jgi:hypothetical protein